MASAPGDLAQRIADTVVAWRHDRHPAGGRRSPGRHVELLDELTALVDGKLKDHPMPVRIRPSKGDDDTQLREHLVAVLREEMPKDPTFHDQALDLWARALEAAITSDGDGPGRRAGGNPGEISAENWLERRSRRPRSERIWWDARRSSSRTRWLSPRAERDDR